LSGKGGGKKKNNNGNVILELWDGDQFTWEEFSFLC